MFSILNRRFVFRFGLPFLIVGVLLFVEQQSMAQTQLSPIELFDGHTANGWGKANGKPHPGWVVEDGALHRKSGGGDLYHETTFRDFVLYFEWKISKGGNSGVKYRVRKYGNRRLGCEYQILDDLNNEREGHKTAGLYDVYSPSANKPIVQPDVWQVSKIVVCGNRIEHWLNGIQVVRATVGSEEWKQHVADSKFRDDQGFGENREGQIFLQDHGNPVWFRRIVLVPLIGESNLNCDSNLNRDSNDPHSSPWVSSELDSALFFRDSSATDWPSVETNYFERCPSCQPRRGFSPIFRFVRPASGCRQPRRTIFLRRR